MSSAHRAAERIARESHGRLVAALARHDRDLATAEDALSEAFRAALEQWPRDGVPRRPEAWLLTAARRRLLDRYRRRRVRTDTAPRVAHHEVLLRTVDEETPVPDHRLALLFVCGHPAIDPADRTPLMLQTVLGLSAEAIAAAFLTRPATMAQRLVRAKRRIRDAGIPFTVPDLRAWPERLPPVLDAIAAAYGEGWDRTPGSAGGAAGLRDEARWLSRVLVDSLPDAAEAWGLRAWLLFLEARAHARRGPDGDYLPLPEQDPARWRRTDLAAAEEALHRADARRRAAGEAPGIYQLLAAIQSAHMDEDLRGEARADALALLYEGLLGLRPTVGVHVARAAALAEARGPEAGLEALDRLPDEAVGSYQPYWATRAHLLGRAGRAGADRARQRAIGLTEDPAVRAWLLRQG
jgi:predicted RNA polymerase sigma factor